MESESQQGNQKRSEQEETFIRNNSESDVVILAKIRSILPVHLIEGRENSLIKQYRADPAAIFSLKGEE